MPEIILYCHHSFYDLPNIFIKSLANCQAKLLAYDIVTIYSLMYNCILNLREPVMRDNRSHVLLGPVTTDNRSPSSDYPCM